MRTADGYKTKQRQKIEDCLKDNINHHMTVDDIVFYLVSKGDAIGKTTVYRTLEKLVKENKVRKYVTGKNESACFQYLGASHTCSQHFHLKCVDCGNLLHVESEKINQISQHIASEHGFFLDAAQTVLYGRCEICRKG